MKTTSGAARDLLPHGERLRRAVLWIAERREADPAADPLRVIEEASLRFDLRPPEVEYLLTTVSERR